MDNNAYKLNINKTYKGKPKNDKLDANQAEL